MKTIFTFATDYLINEWKEENKERKILISLSMYLKMKKEFCGEISNEELVNIFHHYGKEITEERLKSWFEIAFGENEKEKERKKEFEKSKVFNF